MNILNALKNDENGFVVSAELVLVGTILVLGMIVGMTELSYNVNQELEDLGSGIGAINQTYYYTLTSGKMAERLLTQFELIEKRDTIAQELSRGMRQKVAICCAYLHQPEAILFDEPLTGLDPRAIRTLKESIRQRAAAGAAVMVSSHLLDLIDDLCTHLLLMHRGQCLFQGTLQEAKSKLAEHGATDGSLEDFFFQLTERTN